MLDDLMGRIAGRFGRVEPRRRARAFVLGLLADLPRKNCWTIAEHAGDATPDGMQHLLAARAGTRMVCAMTCAVTSPSTWVTRRPCWSSMRPAT